MIFLPLPLTVVDGGSAVHFPCYSLVAFGVVHAIDIPVWLCGFLLRSLLDYALLFFMMMCVELLRCMLLGS